MTQQFAAYGYDIVDSGDHADVYVINSCTVTASGDKKTRQMIHRMKRENPGAVIAMTGCFPQAFPEEAQKLSEVDVLVGAGEKKKVLDYVNEYLQKGERIVRITPHTRDEGFEQMSAGSCTAPPRFCSARMHWVPKMPAAQARKLVKMTSGI